MSDDVKALIAEARDWAERALPPSPWADNHIALRLADALEASVQAPALDVEKATSRHFGSALSRFVESFNGDEAGDIDYMEAADGANGWAMRGGNDVEAVFGNAIAALVASGILLDAAEERRLEANTIANLIAKEARPGMELNHDGTEDRETAAYVEGIRVAHGVALARAQQVREGN